LASDAAGHSIGLRKVRYGKRDPADFGHPEVSSDATAPRECRHIDAGTFRAHPHPHAGGRGDGRMVRETPTARLGCELRRSAGRQRADGRNSFLYLFGCPFLRRLSHAPLKELETQ
jgi:hypothetical protein